MSATDGRVASLADARVLDWEQVERLPESATETGIGAERALASH